METVYQRRIRYKGKIEKVSKIICEYFNLGNFVANKIITFGYEDFNLALETTKNKYLVKISSDFRSLKDCKRYIDVIVKALKAGVNHPRLIKSNQGYFHVIETDNSTLRLCVMDFINGHDFLRVSITPNTNEIKFLAQQATLINSMDIKPSFVYDSWAIVNFPNEFKKKSKYLTYGEMELIQPLLEEFRNLNIEKLPHCFVHGDIISTNVMKDNNKQIWITDFAVANYYPRIQELAVLACDLLFNRNSKNESENNLKIALNEYQKFIHLTPEELRALPTYIRLAHAMHVLCSRYEKIVNNNKSKENEYFLEQGEAGLNQMSE